MVIVDDSDHWQKHSNELEIAAAIAEFFKRKLMKRVRSLSIPSSDQVKNKYA